MISKEQITHDLAVSLTGVYVANELTRGEYKDMDVCKAMSVDAQTLYQKFLALLTESKGL